MVRSFVLLVLVLAPGLVLAAPVGQLVSLEGEVSVVRAGVTIPSERIGEGFALEPADSVLTGALGRASIRFLPVSGLAGSVRLDAETSLWIDVGPGSSAGGVAGIELLSGGVSVALGSPSRVVEVRTDAGAFRGTGPAFRVVGSSAGNYLVVATAGKVACRVGQRTVAAEPGTLVEVRPLEEGVLTHPSNAATAAADEATWVQQELQAFRDQAAVLFRVLASRYLLDAGRFQRAWDRVEREAQDGVTAVAAARERLAAAAGPLDRSLPRVRALGALVDEGILSRSLELTRGYAAGDFFRQLAADAPVLQAGLASARGPATTRGPAPSEVTVGSDYFR